MKTSIDHLQSLSKESRAAVEQLNRDPKIGPLAPGDGDLIEWGFCFVDILIYEFHTRHPNIKLQSQTQNYPTERIGNESIDTYLRRLVRSLLLGLFLANDSSSGLEIELESLCLVFDIELAQQFGGRRIRIGMRSKRRDNPKRVISASLRQGQSLDIAFKKAGVSRATGYRILKKKN